MIQIFRELRKNSFKFFLGRADMKSGEKI